MDQSPITEERLVELFTHLGHVVFVIRDTEGILISKYRSRFYYLGKFGGIDTLDVIDRPDPDHRISKLGVFGSTSNSAISDAIRYNPNKEEIFEIVRANWKRTGRMTKSAARSAHK